MPNVNNAVPATGADNVLWLSQLSTLGSQQAFPSVPHSTHSPLCLSSSLPTPSPIKTWAPPRTGRFGVGTLERIEQARTPHSIVALHREHT